MGQLIGIAYQVMLSDLARALADAGLNVTAAEYLVLRTLYEHDGVQQCDIATAIRKDKGAVCRTVGSLASKGLVSTEAVSHKCLRVYLTDEARSIEPAVMSVAEGLHKDFISIGTTEEMQIFKNILIKIIKKGTLL